MTPPLRSAALLARLPRSVSPRTKYVCLQCRHRTELETSRPLVPLVPRRYTSNSGRKTSVTERLRRKIWGTQDPPGQADPYADVSVEDQNRRQLEGLKLEADTSSTPSMVSQTIGSTGVSSYADYVPATTWEGLDQIGGAAGWWEEAWDQQHYFNGFMRPGIVDSDDAIQEAVRRAVIEVHILRRVKRSLHTVTNIPPENNVDLSDVRFIRTDENELVVHVPSLTTAQKILNSMSAREIEKIQAKSSSTMQKEPSLVSLVDEMHTVDEYSPNSDSIAPFNGHEDFTWVAVPLRDRTIKFAVVKRVMQLTGKRIADPVIALSIDAGALAESLMVKPKPKKLAQLLVTQPNLTSIPNIQIYNRRYTPIDKEKEVGRWKVIEKELGKRGLPITGRVV